MSRRWIAACACLAFAGCGSDPQLGATAEDELRSAVDAARTAAGEGDREGALSALDRLHTRIERAEADGELAESDATALRQGVRRAKRRVEQELPDPAPAEAPEATEAAPEEPPPDEEDEGEGEEEGGEPGTGNDEQKGRGEAEGKGKGRGQEGDD